MNTFSSNLLNQALSHIANQEVEYLAFQDNVTMPDGSKASNFHAPIILRGSFQPVNAMSKQYLGLNLNKNYANFYVCADLMPLHRESAADRICFNNKHYQIVSETDWYAVDSWKSVLLIEVNDE